MSLDTLIFRPESLLPSQQGHTFRFHDSLLSVISYGFDRLSGALFRGINKNAEVRDRICVSSCTHKPKNGILTNKDVSIYGRSCPPGNVHSCPSILEISFSKAVIGTLFPGQLLRSHGGRYW